MEEHEFLLRNSQKLSEKYPGKCIAMVGGEFAGVGRDRIEAYQKAKEKYPDKEVSIAYLPTDEEMVTLLGLI